MTEMNEKKLSEQEVPITENAPQHLEVKQKRLGRFLLTCLIILILILLAIVSFMLFKVNTRLTDKVSLLTKESAEIQESVVKLKSSLNTVQDDTKQLKEVSVKQEAFMTEWHNALKGDMNKWHVVEAEHLVTLANQSLQFSNNIKVASVLLQEADKTLQATQDANLNTIRKSLANDLLRVQALPAVDVSAIYLKLTALNQQIDKLKLPLSPMQADKTNKAIAAKEPAAETTLPWWKSALSHSLDMLSKIVIVRNTGQNALALVLPEEKPFLYQNLHAQIEGAIWGLLHHQQAVYETSLTRVAAWIKQYFDQADNETQTVLQTLTTLQKENVQPVTMNFNDTLRLFELYHKQAG